MKKFICGLCNAKKGKVYVGTREGLRKHIRDVHMILKEIANSKHDKNDNTFSSFRQRWWMTEEVPYGM